LSNESYQFKYNC